MRVSWGISGKDDWMRAYDLILKKRNGKTLTQQEINYLVEGYTAGKIPDYQMSAFCMAVFFQGMEPREIADLTMAMARSGDMLSLSGIEGRKIDKHSTGGVGDTTTLVLAPLVASCGVPVAKMSGRGLGHTGGTIDKLESIAGFQVAIPENRFIEQVNSIKVSVVGQTGELAPADKALYALRDVTATVESIPLIASSIMSKKLAAGADGFVLDVKCGQGAFMQNRADAVRLAKTMVSIGAQVGKDTVALVTDMNQPLGYAIGNALEVKEAILTLDDSGPEDLRELCLLLGTEMLLLAGRCNSETEARELLVRKLASKQALVKLKEMIEAQGGDSRVVGDLARLPQAKLRYSVKAEASGSITAIDSLEVGLTAMSLGAGRETKDSTIDLAVGLELRKKVGDGVEQGEEIALLHANDQGKLDQAIKRIKNSFQISQNSIGKLPLLYEKITSADLNDV